MDGETSYAPGEELPSGLPLLTLRLVCDPLCDKRIVHYLHEFTATFMHDDRTQIIRGK